MCVYLDTPVSLKAMGALSCAGDDRVADLDVARGEVWAAALVAVGEERVCDVLDDQPAEGALDDDIQVGRLDGWDANSIEGLDDLVDEPLDQG